MIRFSVTTLGCKVNQYDAAAISASLTRPNIVQATKHQQSDLLVINTCCITTVAMRKSRQAIRRAIRRCPKAAVLVTGCYSDYDAKRISGILHELGIPAQRAYVSGHHGDIGGLIEQIADDLYRTSEKDSPAPGQSVCDHTSIRTRRNAAVKRKAIGTRNLRPIATFGGHQRAFVKVQDGCDAFCSYCIVPYTRANVWSKTVRQSVDECKALVDSGHREIVLAGVFLGAFGRDTAIRKNWKHPRSKLPDLLSEIASIDGLWRIRLSSLEPGDCTTELINLFRDTPNIAPHLHLPLQSGSNNILKAMKRQYTADEFCDTADRLHNTLDRPAITTDIIVGFPGETEDDFLQTLNVARHGRLAKIHAFPFSAIEGTIAWTMRNQAPKPEVVKERLARLAELETTMATDYRTLFVGQEMEALVESTRPGPQIRQAMTDRYLSVQFGSPEHQQLTGKVVTLMITGVTKEGLTGEF